MTDLEPYRILINRFKLLSYITHDSITKILKFSNSVDFVSELKGAGGNKL